jgi:hypothetical protein
VDQQFKLELPMALPDNYIQVYGQLPAIMKRISEGQAPEKFTRQYLKDIGFSSANYHALIPLLKTLGFLSADGGPTSRYHEYRDASQSRRVLGEALLDSYSDLFTIKASPTAADRGLIEGKFKSTHNATDRTAKLMASTFFALLGLADLNGPSKKDSSKDKAGPQQEPSEGPVEDKNSQSRYHSLPGLHYTIQIHLPATKDIEVFNSIFKSLREHLID